MNSIIILTGILSIIIMIVITECHYQIYGNYEKTLKIVII